MAATAITKDGEIPGFPAAPRQEREFVSLSEIRLNLRQVFITIGAVGAFLVGIGLGLGRLNALGDQIAKSEEVSNNRFDKIESTLDAIQKELHQQSIDIAQLKPQMVDTKGRK